MSSYDDKFIDELLKLFKKKDSMSQEIELLQQRPLLGSDAFYKEDIINHFSNINGLLKSHTHISIEILKLLKYDMSFFELFQQLSDSIIAENYNACSMLKRRITEKISVINP